jgi:hypothetical protein
MDRLHQSNRIVRLKAVQLLGGLADIAVVDVSQEAPITTRALHYITNYLNFKKQEQKYKCYVVTTINQTFLLLIIMKSSVDSNNKCCHYVILRNAGFAITLHYHPAGSLVAYIIINSMLIIARSTTIFSSAMRDINHQNNIIIANYYFLIPDNS